MKSHFTLLQQYDEDEDDDDGDDGDYMLWDATVIFPETTTAATGGCQATAFRDY